jgi:hypothetical protein
VNRDPECASPSRTPLANCAGLSHLCSRGPPPKGADMKGLEKKKEAKKKPQKSLKEKRAEKHAKKGEHS